jgi:hypothetical protein
MGAARWRRRLVRWTPLGITAGVIAFLFQKYPAELIASELARGTVLPMIPLALGSVVVTLLIVACADLMVIGGCCGRARFMDVLAAKAGSSLVDIVGYVAGHGLYAVWIKRFTSARPGLAGGAMLYVMAGDLAAVCIVAAGAMYFLPVDVPSGLRVVALSVGVLLIMSIITGPYRLFGKAFHLFEPWALVGRTIGFMQIGLRLLQTVFWILVTWWAARLFGLPIPLEAMAAYMPVIMLVGALPINVAGFGAVQGAWLLFTDYAPGAQILAFQFLWQMLISVSVILRGLPFVRRVVNDVDRGEI